MKKVKVKHPDIFQLAHAIVDAATDETESVDDGKNPAALPAGRLGGLKGGKARADKLTPSQRKDIAKVAAAARWKKTED